MNIFFFTGMPGSGKTTLGRQFASSRKLLFVDMDAEIEKREGMSIAEIFAANGESHFRDLERLVLHECARLENVVISTGGGAPCFFDNMNFMLQRGKVVFIDVSPKELVRRMTANKGQDHRPLLAGKSEAKLEEELLDKRQQRLHFYKQADFIFKSDTLTLSHLENRL